MVLIDSATGAFMGDWGASIKSGHVVFRGGGPSRIGLGVEEVRRSVVSADKDRLIRHNSGSAADIEGKPFYAVLANIVEETGQSSGTTYGVRMEDDCDGAGKTMRLGLLSMVKILGPLFGRLGVASSGRVKEPIGAWRSAASDLRFAVELKSALDGRAEWASVADRVSFEKRVMHGNTIYTCNWEREADIDPMYEEWLPADWSFDDMNNAGEDWLALGFADKDGASFQFCRISASRSLRKQELDRIASNVTNISEALKGAHRADLGDRVESSFRAFKDKVSSPVVTNRIYPALDFVETLAEASGALRADNALSQPTAEALLGIEGIMGTSSSLSLGAMLTQDMELGVRLLRGLLRTIVRYYTSGVEQGWRGPLASTKGPSDFKWSALSAEDVHEYEEEQGLEFGNVYLNVLQRLWCAFARDYSTHIMGVCPHCGRVFSSAHKPSKPKKYCDAYCQKAAKSARQYQRKKANRKTS